jgi:hypothetical protein
MNLEICALKLNINSKNFIIIYIYRSPTENLLYFFLNQLEFILNKLHKLSNELILCDFKINYFIDNSRKDLRNSPLASFNLTSTINFPTRIYNNPCTLIDNICINRSRHDFSVYPHNNGLPDHDAQVIS